MTSIVIMAGGSGKRFWPKSRKNIPKQCLPITSDNPMIKETVERLKPIAQKKDIYIATGNHLEKPIKKILPDVNYVIEPMPKNTAACIGLAAISISDPEEVMIIETSDHSYEDVEAYLKHLRVGIETAKKDKIVLIGITPNFPNTGYGYIHQGELIDEKNNIQIHEIAEFKEKPDIETAKIFFKSGVYLWNSGVFISKASTMLNAIKQHLPELYSSLMKIKGSNFDKDVLTKEFEKLESISIDHGIMEKADNLALIRGNFPWDDIGDWKAMERIHSKDKNNNIILADHQGDAENCIIVGNKKPIHTEKIENLIIVDTQDCLLVCNKQRFQDVKKIVEMLEKDPELKKYTENIQEGLEFHKVTLDCQNLEIKSNCLVATVGIGNIYIEKDSKLIVKGV